MYWNLFLLALSIFHPLAQKHIAPKNDTYFSKSKGMDFTLVDTAGKKVSLSDFKGKFVVISMQAYWCTPCRMEVAPTKDLQAYFVGKNVEWVFISFDRDEKSWTESRHKDGLKGIHLWGTPDSDPIKKLFKFNKIPYYIWIDTDGTIAMDDAPRPSSKGTRRQLELYIK